MNLDTSEPELLHDQVDALCDRIDATEPDVHAYVPEPDRRARLHEEAEDLLSRWPDADERPSLFGRALGVKDVMHTRGWMTRAGSAVDPAAFASAEAVVVRRLRDAGALVVGKTVTAEFASKAPGETRNPHDLSRTPGGSSSGSAAAVWLGTADIATGTQTIGSVIRPAAFCGIVGIKPTHSRASIDGIVAHSPSFDTPGVLARDLATARVAAAVMWDRWEPNVEAPGHHLVVATGAYLEQTEPQARKLFAEAVDALRDHGWSVDDSEVLFDLADVRVHNLVINRYELAQVHATWFDAHRAAYRIETVEAIEEGRAISTDRYVESVAHLRAFRDDVDRRLAALATDAVITPAALGPAPVGIETTGDPAMAMPWTYAGLPAVALPAGRSSEGLPIGVQLVGRRGGDERLVDLASSVEPVVAGVSG
jgi:Asp-tRNA(Asn)/Glu-tRNA(Gln) amidotransferase A subunit family amidase